MGPWRRRSGYIPFWALLRDEAGGQHPLIDPYRHEHLAPTHLRFEGDRLHVLEPSRPSSTWLSDQDVGEVWEVANV